MNIAEIKNKLIPLLTRYKIKKAGVFGSYAKGNQNLESDIDILVELGTKISLLDFVAIKQEIEKLLEKKIDLVEYQALKPRLRNRILSEEIRIYG
ncbi:MAG: nucleotidyltransferase family protein [Candidatus Kapaibacteriales bacterium]